MLRNGTDFEHLPRNMHDQYLKLSILLNLLYTVTVILDAKLFFVDFNIPKLSFVYFDIPAMHINIFNICVCKSK